MGYSAAAEAFRTLDLIGKVLDHIQPDRGTSNGFREDKNHRENFWEIGREQADGAITGTILGEKIKGSGEFYPVGRVRIEANGDISCFTRLPRNIRSELRTAEQRRIVAFEMQRKHTLAQLGKDLDTAWNATQDFASIYQGLTGTSFLMMPAPTVTAMYAFVKGLSL